MGKMWSSKSLYLTESWSAVWYPCCLVLKDLNLFIALDLYLKTDSKAQLTNSLLKNQSPGTDQVSTMGTV